MLKKSDSKWYEYISSFYSCDEYGLRKILNAYHLKTFQMILMMPLKYCLWIGLNYAATQVELKCANGSDVEWGIGHGRSY